MYAQFVLINKISASELSRKFIEGALLVGLSLCPKKVLPGVLLECGDPLLLVEHAAAAGVEQAEQVVAKVLPKVGKLE